MSEHRDRAIVLLAKATTQWADGEPEERDLRLAAEIVDELAVHAVELMWAELRREEARRT